MADKKQYTLLVFSDSHGSMRNLEKMLPAINASDYCIFLGDGNRDFDKLQERIAVPLVRVRGNCDIACDRPTETELTVGNTKFLITHGNAYGVKSSVISLCERARECGCAWALYGHTHRSRIDDLGGVTVLNPGTASGSSPTYARICGDGEYFSAEILPIE